MNAYITMIFVAFQDRNSAGMFSCHISHQLRHELSSAFQDRNSEGIFSCHISHELRHELSSTIIRPHSRDTPIAGMFSRPIYLNFFHKLSLNTI